MAERVSLYRKVEVRMWSDENFCALSPLPPSGQSLWLFLLTGPFTGPIPGLLRVGRASMAEALNWELEAFDKAFDEVFAKGMIKADWKARFVWIPKAILSNPPASPNVIISWSNEWDLLPECPLKVEAFSAVKASISSMGEAFGKAFDKAIRKPSIKPLVKASEKTIEKTMGNQEQEQEQDKDRKPFSSGNPESEASKPRKNHGTAADHKAARWIYECVLVVNATAQEPNWDAWANEIRLMREQDKRTHEEICELFGWANCDGFWRTNIMSPAKLREKWDQLTVKRADKRAGRSSKPDNFVLGDVDHSSSQEAMKATMDRLGLETPPEGTEIKF